MSPGTVKFLFFKLFNDKEEIRTQKFNCFVEKINVDGEILWSEMFNFWIRLEGEEKNSEEIRLQKLKKSFENKRQ